MQWTYAPGFTALRGGWERSAGQIGLIELNRPEKSNAFDGAMFEELPRVGNRVCSLEQQQNAGQCLPSRTL